MSDSLEGEKHLDVAVRYLPGCLPALSRLGRRRSLSIEHYYVSLCPYMHESVQT